MSVSVPTDVNEVTLTAQSSVGSPAHLSGSWVTTTGAGAILVEMG